MTNSVTDSIDPFSCSHPSNRQGGRWKRLRKLDPNDTEYLSIENQFYMGWKHPHKRKPRVKAIYKVLSPDSLLLPYHQHLVRIATALFPHASMANPANEQLLFHGTNRACQLGESKSRIELCMVPQCHLCPIIRNSFDITKCGMKNKFRRFGSGIYTTAISSKADDYCRNVGPASPIRVLLLSRVIVGKPHVRKHNAEHLTSAPSGFHSVVGEPGEKLNYQETVVYHNDAIRPAYLIAYGDEVDPPIEKSKRKLSSALKDMFKAPLAS